MTSSEIPLATGGLGPNYDGMGNTFGPGAGDPSMGPSGPNMPPSMRPPSQMIPPSMGPPMHPNVPVMTASAFQTRPPPPVTGAIPASAQRNDLFTQAFQTRPAPPATRKDESGVRDVKWHGGRHFLAYMFTLAAFIVFAAPIVISIVLASDNDVSFWIGRHGYLAIFVPIYLVAQHLYHLWMLTDKTKQTRYIFLITPLLPAFLFMFIGGTYMSYGRFLYGQLKSNDCSPSAEAGLPEKYWLQESYAVAHKAWLKCLDRKKVDNMHMPLRRIPTLQSCSEWHDMVDTHSVKPWKPYKFDKSSPDPDNNPSHFPRWQYLANSEVNHMCSGFCHGGPPLWTISQKLGLEAVPCAEIVSFRFLSVAHYGFMVFTIGALVFVLTFPIFYSAKGFLEGLGYKSSTSLA